MKGGTVGHTLRQDLALAQAWGFAQRDAVRVVARMTLRRAAEGAVYTERYLRDLHHLMVTTA